ncbi:unnamed protein product [Rhodiola kirilowii]
MESVLLVEKPSFSGTKQLNLQTLTSPSYSSFIKHDKYYSTSTTRRSVTTNCNGSENVERALFTNMKKNNSKQAAVSKMLPTDHDYQYSAVVEASGGCIGIAGYLEGKNYFITGATGFLAKVFIEKILRSTLTVGKLYLLIKAENKAAATERLQTEIIDSELFICLKQMFGDSYQNFMIEKLVPVLGNVCEANLGMDADLAEEIASEVDVIVNSAASTCFDERYDVALNINTMGPYRLLSFAKLCKKLQMFTHVSTAYVNGEREGVVLEKPFKMGESIAAERARSVAERSSMPMLDIEAELSLAASTVANSTANVSQKMKDLGVQRAKAYGWQNTYVFTKAMGEMVLSSMRGDIPLVIMRPSVIECIAQEPVPGWIQGNRMLDPLIISYGKGRLPGFPMDPQAVIDVVPADMVVNAFLAALAKHGKEGKPSLSIYHISSSVANPLVLEDVFSYSHAHFTTSALLDTRGKKIDVERLQYFSSVENFSSYIQGIIRHELSRSSDYSTLPTGQLPERLETKCRKKVEHFFNLAKIYAPFMFYRGWFDNSNTENLFGMMSAEEQRMFGFNVRNINWEDYFLNVHIPGLKRHVLKNN